MTISKTNLATPANNSSNWDTPLNSNFGILNNALGGALNISITTADVTLTATQAQNAIIAVTGLTAARNLFLPAGTVGTWTVANGSSYTLYVQSAGTYVTILSGYTTNVYCPDGTNVYSSENNRVLKTGDTMTGALNLPTDGLNVGSGEFYVSGGNVYTSGSYQANVNVTALSDERIKTDIETIENALDLVKRLRGVRYTRKDTGDKCVGVISQEVQAVVPELVVEGKDGLLHMAYGNTVSLLINAIHELSDRIEKLEAK